MSAPTILHAGLVALRLGGVWQGVLITGRSGSGKSDLALRALEAGFRLAADDRTLVFLSQGQLYGRAPEALAGLLEVRGVGVLRETALPFARIAMVAACVEGPRAVDRMPESEAMEILGVGVPRLTLWPLEPAAPVKLRRALEHLGERRQQAYLASLAPPGRRFGG